MKNRPVKLMIVCASALAALLVAGIEAEAANPDPAVVDTARDLLIATLPA